MDDSANYPNVGIVILNWNQPGYTIACLKSLERLDYPSFDVVVVDNGSTDGSPQQIRFRFPQVFVLENGRNLGFAAGNNVGIRYLLNRGADYVLLLNNDTEVAADFLRILVATGEETPDVGVLGPKIFYYSHPNVIWSAGGRVDRYGRPIHLHVDEIDESPEQVSKRPPQEVDYVTGCAILIKRGVIEQVGVLDERFFIYFEETEWCARARRVGFRVAYVPRSRLWHKIEQSARNTSGRYLYLMTRNRLLYLKCTHAGLLTILAAAADLLRTVAAWSFRAELREMRPCSGALLRGIRDFALGRYGAPPAWL